MERFQIHTADTAPPGAGHTLQGVRDSLGFIPNIFAVIAESAPALTAFVELNTQLAQTSLTPMERELIQIVTSAENQCTYCVAGHTAFAAAQNLPEDVVEAARRADPIPDAQLEALQQITRALVRKAGRVDQDTVDAFYAAGYSPQQLLEVVLGVCVKVFSNLVNNVIGIPLDDEFAPYAWQVVTDVADV